MSKPPSSKLADAYQTYPTADAAAAAALRGVTVKNFESGGGVLYNKEQNVYAATQPVGQADGEHFAASVSVPKGWQLHSTYHTHPSGPRSTQFSDDDISTAQQLKVPSYVLALDDNKIRVFDPASSKVAIDTNKRFNNRYSNGSVVDETPPTPPVATEPSPTPVPPVGAAPAAPAATVPVTGSKITMRDFAARHRVQKYKHKTVHIK